MLYPDDLEYARVKIENYIDSSTKKILESIKMLEPTAIPESKVNEINPFRLFSSWLKEDDEDLLGWHSNIACWFMDNLHLNHNTSNQLAKRFIKHFFEIDYNLEDLVYKKKNCCRGEL